MSWSAYMRIDTGGEYPAVVQEIRDMTYNNSKILKALGVHPNDISAKTGAEVRPLIEKALIRLIQRTGELKRLEPENGWGGVEDVRNFLNSVLDAVKRHPKATLDFS